MPNYSIKPQLQNGGEGNVNFQHNIAIKVIESENLVGVATLVIVNYSNEQFNYQDVKNYLSANNFKVTFTTFPGDPDPYTIGTGNVYTLGVTGGRGGATSAGYDCLYLDSETNELFAEANTYSLYGDWNIDDETTHGNTIVVEDIISTPIY